MLNALPVAVARLSVSRLFESEHKDIGPVVSASMHDDVRNNESLTVLLKLAQSGGRPKRFGGSPSRLWS